jgi:surface antigen
MAGFLCAAVSASPALAAGTTKAPLPAAKPGLERVAVPLPKPAPAAKKTVAPGAVAQAKPVAVTTPVAVTKPVAVTAAAKPEAKPAAPAAAKPATTAQAAKPPSQAAKPGAIATPQRPVVQAAAATTVKPPKAVQQQQAAARSTRWTCVKYVQAYGSVALRGDGWQWWDNAAGVYDRGNAPKPGAVLVLKRTGHLRSGHVAIVSKVIDRRTILVDHANWGWSRDTKGKVHLGMRVVDVSPKNDWSQTRFWFEPGDTLGSRTYPAYGFVYAPRATRPGPGLPQTRGARG